ncbi:DUF6615 family protein [Streptomyces sp. NPDC001073]
MADLRSANAGLLGSLTSARQSIDEFTRFWLNTGEMWSEESATDLLCWKAAPHLRPIKFNRHQEADTGADWLWWFIDRNSGTCFGMLCQAKNLRRTSSGWHIKYDQKSKHHAPQMDALRQTADDLKVPDVYVLYCGDSAYREGLDCLAGHGGRGCARCERAGVSLISGLLARYFFGLDPKTAAVDSFRHAMTLEGLADPDLRTGYVWDVNFRECPEELKRFLAMPQYGSAEVAKKVLTQLIEKRRGDAFVADGRRVTTSDDAVFRRVPGDRGHFGEPYLGTVLRGLRRTVPPYVADALDGRGLPPWLVERVDGLVVTHLDDGPTKHAGSG